MKEINTKLFAKGCIRGPPSLLSFLLQKNIQYCQRLCINFDRRDDTKKHDRLAIYSFEFLLTIWIKSYSVMFSLITLKLATIHHYVFLLKINVSITAFEVWRILWNFIYRASKHKHTIGKMNKTKIVVCFKMAAKFSQTF